MTLTIPFEKEARRVLESDVFLAVTSAYKKGTELLKIMHLRYSVNTHLGFLRHCDSSLY